MSTPFVFGRYYETLITFLFQINLASNTTNKILKIFRNDDSSRKRAKKQEKWSKM